MTSAQKTMLDNLAENLKLKGWTEEEIARSIRAAAGEPPVIPPPIAEAKLRNLMGKHGLPIAVSQH